MNKPQTHLIDLLFFTIPFPSTIKYSLFTNSPFHNYRFPIANSLLFITYYRLLFNTLPLALFTFSLALQNSPFTYSPIHNYLSPLLITTSSLLIKTLHIGSFYFLLGSLPFSLWLFSFFPGPFKIHHSLIHPFTILIANSPLLINTLPLALFPFSLALYPHIAPRTSPLTC